MILVVKIYCRGSVHGCGEGDLTKESKQPTRNVLFPEKWKINEKIIFMNVDNQYDNDYHYHIKNIPCSTIQCREDEL